MIVAGFGFRGSATPESLRDALDQAAGELAVAALCAPDDKVESECLLTLAQALSLPVRPVAAAAVTETATATQSPEVLKRRGTGSVAEATALAGAGHGSRLLSKRCISADRQATCAIAEGTAK
ncbi:cobalamin biosynthesis protein [Algihabitans albus]|uniref:cobalamin biosynthesis protein n=1 Tax=Algihabitans albus TaxID=2164067 RepID=UPI000E5D98A6|nr:cobalamin biosynthesis protein [Algihabitans albus]